MKQNLNPTEIRVKTRLASLSVAITLFAGCASKSSFQFPPLGGRGARGFEADIAKQIAVLERDPTDERAWAAFAAIHETFLDGERAFMFSIACGELARRDPAFFLRKHLTGDPQAVPIGRVAYRWIVADGQRMLDLYHASRMRLSGSQDERAKIEAFVVGITQ